MKKTIVPARQLEALGRVYLDFDRAFNRTRSRAAADGGVLLLSIIDELRRMRQLMEKRHQRAGGVTK